MKNIQKFLILYSVSTLLSIGSAHASLSAVAFGLTGGGVHSTSDITLGYNFTVNSNSINITNLGFWDMNNDGFVSSHQIGIWDTSGHLLTSTTLATGSGATLLNGFRYASLSTALLLNANTTYVIGGNIGSDGYVQNSSVTNLGTAVSFGISRLNNSATGFLFPNTGFPADTGAYFGPNFQYTVSAVPVPAAVWLFGTGLVGLTGLARKRKAA